MQKGGKKMAGKKRKDAKERILKAAVSLFARKGYFAVGVREIAKAADVNVSSIFYYFGEKVGILEAIVSECYEKYHRAVIGVGDEDTSLEERVRMIVRNLVAFFREDIELAMVTFNSLPVDIPEIMSLNVKWLCEHRGEQERLFRQLGVDPCNAVQTSVICRSLTSSIQSHFQARYVVEHVLKAPDQPPEVVEVVKQSHVLKYDDAFYEEYSEMLSRLFLDGLRSIVAQPLERTEDSNAEREGRRGE
jgi:AcrR family transcriptional regulator